jgi:cellulose synthase operon protein YhjQ
MPEDIATLYSRAHIQGTRYWDFSASRKEVRGQLRHRASAAKAPAAVVTAPRELPQTIPFHAPSQEAPLRAATAASIEPRAHIETTAQASSRPTLPASQKAGEPGARWYALHSVFSPAEALPPPTQPITAADQPPLMAIFSLAGGVGKTCLAATLGRALSSLGERVLLADTAACGLLPFYFGSRELKRGIVRTFSPPASGTESEAPVHVLNLDAEHYPGNSDEQDPLLDELIRDGRNASRVLIDVATASREVTRRLLRLRPAVLVPLLPDMSSVASLGILENLLGRGGEGDAQIFYLLNQFDASSPLHQDLRNLLQQRLGDRLLPFVLSRSAAVSEALAEGMTVIDYAPGSPVAEDYWNLAGWLRSFAAPAAVGLGGVRWSER